MLPRIELVLGIKLVWGPRSVHFHQSNSDGAFTHARSRCSARRRLLYRRFPSVTRCMAAVLDFCT